MTIPLMDILLNISPSHQQIYVFTYNDILHMPVRACQCHEETAERRVCRSREWIRGKKKTTTLIDEFYLHHFLRSLVKLVHLLEVIHSPAVKIILDRKKNGTKHTFPYMTYS